MRKLTTSCARLAGNGMSRRTRSLLRPALALLASAAIVPSLHPAEGGGGFYLLGSRGAMAGFTPPQGVYIQNDLYVYSGDASAGVDLDLGGRLVANVNAKSVLNMSTALWVTPVQVLGGDLAFTATIPIGGLDIDGNVVPSPL